MKLSTTTKKFLGNSGWMIGQQVYYMLLSLVIGSLSARYLGPSNYGIINYGSSIISFFSIICKLGLDGVIINEMIKTPEKQGTYLGTALVMRLITSISSFFMVWAFVGIMEPGNKEIVIVTVLQAFAVILQTYEVFTYWFQLKLKMKYVSIATMVGQTAVGVWRILLLVNKASVYMFALSSSVLALISGIIVAISYFCDHEREQKLKVSLADGKYLLKNSYHYIIAAVAITFYMQIDKIMIGKMIDSTAVGIYSTATLIAGLWEFVPTALVNSSRPLIIEEKKKSYDAYIKKFQMLLLGISVLSLIVSVGMMLLGKVAILIMYGRDYLEATAPLSILIWSTGFAMLGTARGIWLVTEGYNRYSKNMVIMGAILNFLLNSLFIPKWGITGAAITTLISQVFVSLIAPLLYKDTRRFDRIYFDSFKLIPEICNKAKEVIKKHK